MLTILYINPKHTTEPIDFLIAKMVESKGVECEFQLAYIPGNTSHDYRKEIQKHNAMGVSNYLKRIGLHSAATRVAVIASGEETKAFVDYITHYLKDVDFLLEFNVRPAADTFKGELAEGVSGPRTLRFNSTNMTVSNHLHNNDEDEWAGLTMLVSWMAGSEQPLQTTVVEEITSSSEPSPDDV